MSFSVARSGLRGLTVLSQTVLSQTVLRLSVLRLSVLSQTVLRLSVLSQTVLRLSVLSQTVLRLSVLRLSVLRLSVLRLSVLSLTLVTACSPSSSTPPTQTLDRTPSAPIAPSGQRAEAAPVDSLYSSVGSAEIEGTAAALLQTGASIREQVLLDLDFEDGRLGGLNAFSDRGKEKEVKELMGVNAAPGDSGKALQIEGGAQAPLCARTAPIPVQEGGTYRLTYQVRSEGLEGPPGPRYRIGTAEALFYAVPSFHHNAEGHLRDAGNRKREAVRAVGTARGPEKKGTSAWATHTLEFTVPPTANFMVLSFDHSRTSEDGPLSKPGAGRVWFDSIKLVMRDEPLNARYANPDDLNQTPHPLQMRVELPAADRGADTRYALFAPTRTVYRFSRTLPPDARLSLAAGVLREGAISGKGKVRFAVEVVERESRTEVWTTTLDPVHKDTHTHWQDHLIDLSAYGGKAVTLELRTEAERPEDEGMFPGAAAVWGDPVLFSRAGRGRLIVMTVIDTVSVSHVSAYGYGRPTTPHLERIAREGVLFETALSAAPWTLPSFASLFTGVDAARHGAGERAWGEVVWRRPLPERFVTLAEHLRSRGFQTTAYVNNPYLTSAFGLGQGFTTYLDYGVGTRTGAGELGVNHALEWLEDHRGYDRFVVMHLMDAHGPYRPPREWAGKFTDWSYTGRFAGEMKGQDYLDLAEGTKPAEDEATRDQVRNLYDGALAYADLQTGRFYDEIRKRAGTDDLTFIVTSDHGEEFWEHGGYEHGHQAYQEMLRVPLVVVNSTRFTGGQRVEEPVRLTDLVPTLLDLSGMSAPQGLDGFSLLPLLEGREAPWKSPRALFAENELYGALQNALVEGEWKYMYNMENTERPHRRPKSTHRHELYALPTDPREQVNVGQQQSQTLLRLHGEMDRHSRPMMAGRYVLALEGGGQARRFTGTLQLPAGATWFAYYEDMIAPLPDGKQAPLSVRMRGQELSFDVTATRALLSFRPQNAPATGGGVTLTANVDGAAWTSGVLTGSGQAVGGGEESLRLADEQLTVAPEAIPDPLPTTAAIWIGKTSERSLARSQQKALPPETAERLRALGYLE